MDLPLELDDETWALLDMNGKINTPRVPDPDKPSLLTVFNHYARFSSEFEKLIKNYKVNRPPLNSCDFFANELISARSKERR